ncbi:hypothetical protein J4H86_21240 [Spiractinospora alimapuensis]|uniref:hypothetical protein n=1 Tax=Spiractinospora alimapuensis TaxID=2820884 RepID=UPI001F431699|nr:hypothetical protein [Spiractinospora alimapuensis]QVQ51316.1 hypothetical protein J4H86_21240 [Spiractinospora alimapuensis]
MSDPIDLAAIRVDQLDRVRDLHRPVPGQGYLPDGGYGDIAPSCSSCGTPGEYAVPWPCPTIRVVDGKDDQ